MEKGWPESNSNVPSLSAKRADGKGSCVDIVAVYRSVLSELHAVETVGKKFYGVATLNTSAHIVLDMRFKVN